MQMIEQDTGFGPSAGFVGSGPPASHSNFTPDSCAAGRPAMSMLSAGTPTGIAGALRSLDQALDATWQGTPGNWRGAGRQHLTGLHDALVSDTEQPEDGWQGAPRGG